MLSWVVFPKSEKYNQTFMITCVYVCIVLSLVRHPLNDNNYLVLNIDELTCAVTPDAFKVISQVQM